jgi:hypothetical protein
MGFLALGAREGRMTVKVKRSKCSKSAARMRFFTAQAAFDKAFTVAEPESWRDLIAKWRKAKSVGIGDREFALREVQARLEQADFHPSLMRIAALKRIMASLNGVNGTKPK